MQLFYKSVLLLLAGVLFFAGVGVFLSWAPDLPLATLKARWAQTPSQFIDVGGLQVHLRDEGPRDDALPIVLLHGTSASLHTWQGWTEALRTERRVIRMDLPGFALTGPHPQGDYSMAAYVRTVLQVLDALGVQRCVLAGNSLGGQIAWSTAVAAPTRVAQLVLVAASGYPPESASTPIEAPLGFRLARLPLARPLMEHLLPRGVVQNSMRAVYGDPSKVTPQLVDLYMDMSLREGNRRALAQRMDQRDTSRSADLRLLRVPTLVLWGGRDRLVPPEFGARFARDVALAQLVEFPELGHVPHEEDPVRTVAALRSFVQQHADR